MKRIIVCLVLVCFSLSLFSCAKSFDVSVMIADGVGFKVKSQNPVKIPYGSDASFEVKVYGGLSVIQVMAKNVGDRDFTYENGILTVKDISAPQTLTLSIGEQGNTVDFSYTSVPENCGDIAASREIGTLVSGTYVTLSASPYDGVGFLGWTVGKAFEDGGKLISSAEKYTYAVKSSERIFANFDENASLTPKIEIDESTVATEKEHVQKASTRNTLTYVLYDANGGNISSDTLDSEGRYVSEYCMDRYLIPNALPENGTFYREGYTLIGYNTEPDGSGEFFRCGHKTKKAIPRSAMILYCMWKENTPESSFEVSFGENSAKIDKFIGNEKSVCIPKVIGGKRVTRISTGAFSDCDIEEVYIPSSVLVIDEAAFSGCHSLEKLHFYDSVTKISDKSFADTNIKTLSLSAADYPRYTDSDLSFGQKYERLTLNRDKNRMIIVSGSSEHFGFDSDYAEDLLGGKYTPVNYGTNAQMNVIFYLEAIANSVKDGDILLYTPEQYGPYCDTVNGNREMTALTYQGFESCYNLLELVDISEYTNVFNAYVQYATTRASMPRKAYDMFSSVIDEYGDCAVPRKSLNSEFYRNGANGSFFFKAGTIPEEFLVNMNRILDIAKENGADVLLGYPPFNKNACAADSRSEESFKAYNEDMKNVVHATLICDVKDYVHEGQYFFNTDYHLNEQGVKIHTEQIVTDLKKYGLD